MRIVFSRKGFDSQLGGIASPIFPDGSMLSLPIPSPEDPHSVDHIHWRGAPISDLLRELSGGRIAGTTRVHLDPDLDAGSVKRPEGWRPAFGQTGAAQSHLTNRGVGPGDLFLFFGWFREVDRATGRWRYVPGSPDRHIVFGWLQIQEVVLVGREPAAATSSYPWLSSHPHVASAPRYRSRNNTVYIGRRELNLTGSDRPLPGAGRFARLSTGLQLTAPGRTRSVWRLPTWFLPADGRPRLTYHESPSRWQRDEEGVLLTTVGKGQEFVLDADSYPEAAHWALELIAAATR